MPFNHHDPTTPHNPRTNPPKPLLWQLLLLGSAPLTVAAIMTLASAASRLRGMDLAFPEMLAAGLLSATGGILAVIPTLLVLRENATQKIMVAALASIVLRVTLLLGGTLLLLLLAFGLQKIPLLFWMLAYYFPLLVMETALMVRIFKITDK